MPNLTAQWCGNFQVFTYVAVPTIQFEDHLSDKHQKQVPVKVDYWIIDSFTHKDC